MRGALCLGLLALSGCRASGLPREPRKPSASAATQVEQPDGLLHEDGTRFDAAASGAVCGSAACGNGRVDSCTVGSVGGRTASWKAEACDGEVGATTCEDLGYAGGTLRCSNTCGWDLSGCEVCPPGQCVAHPPTEDLGGLVSMAIGGDGQRTRMVWSTQHLREGQHSHFCLHTALVDEPGSRTLSCDLDIPRPDNLELEVRSDGLWVTSTYSGHRWSARFSPDGGLVDPQSLTSDVRDERRDALDPLVVGDLTLEVLRYEPWANETPILARWTRDGEPVGETVRIASDPYGLRILAGATPVGDRLWVPWWSAVRGAYAAAIEIPGPDDARDSASAEGEQTENP